MSCYNIRSVLSSLVLFSLGNEIVGRFATRLVVCFVRGCSSAFKLPLAIGGRLQSEIGTLPELHLASFLSVMAY